MIRSYTTHSNSKGAVASSQVTRPGGSASAPFAPSVWAVRRIRSSGSADATSGAGTSEDRTITAAIRNRTGLRSMPGPAPFPEIQTGFIAVGARSTYFDDSPTRGVYPAPRRAATVPRTAGCRDGSGPP